MKKISATLAAGALVGLMAPATAFASSPQEGNAGGQPGAGALRAGSASQATDCGDWVSGVAGYGKWVKGAEAACSYSGYSSVPYAWSVPAGSNGRICVEGAGYKSVSGKTKKVWVSLGCGTSGSGSAPWTVNGLGMPEVRAKVQPGFLGGAYRWRVVYQ